MKNSLIAEAADVSIKPLRLRQLAFMPKEEIRREVAKNPNTPIEVLFILAVHFPSEFFSNPILGLAVMVNPNLLAEAPERARQRLLSHPLCPEGFMRWAQKHGSENDLLALLQNPHTPRPILDELSNHNLPGVAESAQLHSQYDACPAPYAAQLTSVFIDTEEAATLVSFGLIPEWLEAPLLAETDKELKMALAKSEFSSSGVLSVLQWDHDEEVRRLAIQNPNFQPGEDFQTEIVGAKENLLRLPTDLWTPTWIAMQVIQDPNTPAELISQLASHNDWRMRQSVAAHAFLTLEARSVLLEDLDFDVRIAFSGRADLQTKEILKLLLDSEESVRNAALSNPTIDGTAKQSARNLEEKTLPILVPWVELLDAGPYASSLIAAHPNSPKEILARLFLIEDTDLRVAILNHTNAPLETINTVIDETDAVVVSLFCAHRGASIVRLEAFAKSNILEILRAVAGNPKTPAHVLESLGRDSDESVRSVVAQNLATPSELLTALSRDASSEVRAFAFQNPSISDQAFESGIFSEIGKRATLENLKNKLPLEQATLYQLFRLERWVVLMAAQHPLISAEKMKELAANPDWRMREALARNPELPPELIAEMSKDSDYDVRLAIANHPEVLAENLALLAHDETSGIRQVVAAHPLTPQRILRKLSCDDDEDVRSTVASREDIAEQTKAIFAQAEQSAPDLPPEFLREISTYSETGRLWAARNLSTPATLLETISLDESWMVREAVAKNPNTPGRVLARLLTDDDGSVRLLAVENQSTPITPMIGMVGDYDYAVRTAALLRLRVSPNLSQQTVVKILEMALRSSSSFSRACALSSTHLSQENLSKIRHRIHPEWLVRFALAQNPKIDSRVREQLAVDGNRLVRSAAQNGSLRNGG